MYKYYAAIDPGAKGAVVVLDQDGDFVLGAKFDNSCPAEIVARVILPIRDKLAGVVIERVGAAPGQGVSSMFSFGVSVGKVKGALAASGVEYVEVSPQTWQRITGCIEGDPKSRAKIAALKRWDEDCLIPNGCRVVHSGIVDAALMALYLRDTLEGGGQVQEKVKRAKRRVMTL